MKVRVEVGDWVLGLSKIAKRNHVQRCRVIRSKQLNNDDTMMVMMMMTDCKR